MACRFTTSATAPSKARCTVWCSSTPRPSSPKPKPSPGPTCRSLEPTAAGHQANIQVDMKTVRSRRRETPALRAAKSRREAPGRSHNPEAGSRKPEATTRKPEERDRRMTGARHFFLRITVRHAACRFRRCRFVVQMRRRLGTRRGGSFPRCRQSMLDSTSSSERVWPDSSQPAAVNENTSNSRDAGSISAYRATKAACDRG
jgi:hypothetical protein